MSIAPRRRGFRGTSRAIAGLVSLPIWLWLPGATAGQPQSCSPFRQEADRARDCRTKKDLACAEKITQSVLNRDPNNFRARYTEALIVLDESHLDTSLSPDETKVRDGIARLVATSELLHDVSPQCEAAAEAQDWYGIFNTIGTEYYNSGDLKDAERFWLLAYQNSAKLTDATRKKLLTNLGLLYRTKGDYARSANFYQLAVQQGSNEARGPLNEVGKLNALFPSRLKIK